jgi:hypothetical protein
MATITPKAGVDAEAVAAVRLKRKTVEEREKMKTMVSSPPSLSFFPVYPRLH